MQIKTEAKGDVYVYFVSIVLFSFCNSDLSTVTERQTTTTTTTSARKPFRVCKFYSFLSSSSSSNSCFESRAYYCFHLRSICILLLLLLFLSLPLFPFAFSLSLSCHFCCCCCFYTSLITSI